MTDYTIPYTGGNCNCCCACSVTLTHRIPNLCSAPLKAFTTDDCNGNQLSGTGTVGPARYDDGASVGITTPLTISCPGEDATFSHWEFYKNGIWVGGSPNPVTTIGISGALGSCDYVATAVYAKPAGSVWTLNPSLLAQSPCTYIVGCGHIWRWLCGAFSLSPSPRRIVTTSIPGFDTDGYEYLLPSSGGPDQVTIVFAATLLSHCVTFNGFPEDDYAGSFCRVIAPATGCQTNTTLVLNVSDHLAQPTPRIVQYAYVADPPIIGGCVFFPCP